jgi:hypothetical protein
MPAKKRLIKKHTVRAHLQVIELTKAGTSLTLEIAANGQKLGELKIGRGGLFWTGNKRQISNRIDWSRFAALMDQVAYGP